MKFIFTLILQLITVGFLLKLAIRLLIPKQIRKLFSKSTAALCRCSFDILKELKEDFEGEDEVDDVDNDVDNKKVVQFASRTRK